MRFAPVTFQQLSEYQKFIFMGGNEFLYSNLNLESDSTAVVLGGFKGYSAIEIAQRYQCRVKVFEPILEFFKVAQLRLHEFNKVECFNVGVSNSSENLLIYLEDDASSKYGDINISKAVMCEFVSIAEFIAKTGTVIDLIEINVEGSEFDILPRLLEAKNVSVQTYLIQFHRIDADSDDKRSQIHQMLSANDYELVFDFKYIWERWEKCSSPSSKRKYVKEMLSNAVKTDLICIERSKMESS